MLVDIHTNLMWYPDHMSDEFVEFAYAAKKAKMRLSEDVYYAGHEDRYKNAFDSTPETLLKATEDCAASADRADGGPSASRRSRGWEGRRSR